MNSLPTRRAGLASAHVAALLFGLTGILGALITADAALITAGRAAFASAALFGFACWRRRPLGHVPGLARAGVLAASGVVLALHWVSFFVAVKVGGVAMATLGFASFPAFIALLDRLLFGERVGGRAGALLVLVTAGLVLVAPSFDAGDQGTAGLLWGLLSGLTFAMLALINRRATPGLDPMQVAFWQNLVVAAVALPWALRSAGRAGLALSPPDWFWLALLGVFCTGLAHYLFVRSLGVLEARSVAMIVALEPVYAIAAAWWLFAARPSARMLAGALLIILASLLAARRDTGQPAGGRGDGRR